MPAAVDPEFVALQRALAGEYSLERELGRGGMGVVYLAREVQLDRLVAIKVLPLALAARADFRERFLREARTAAKLSHPNIVPIYRVGEAGGFVFFAMAYVDGETLGQRLRTRGPLSATAAARVLREVAWALAYAHEHGVIHRDIKPDNILLERGSDRALVSDFGIAQVPAGAGEITDPGRVLGTAHYMSPEQAVNDVIDGRSDLYALGVVGYLALSGRLPFDAPTVPALLAKHLREPAPALASVAFGVPERLARAIERCLAKDPTARFATGDALAEALDPVAVERSQLPGPLRVWLQKQVPARGFYATWSGICGLVAVASVVEFFVGTRWRSSPDLVWSTTLALAPLVPIGIFHLRESYRVLRAGYTVADLRLAIERWRAERREVLGLDATERTPRLHQLVRSLVYGSGLAILLRITIFMTPARNGPLQDIADVTMFSSLLGGIAVASALGVPLLGRRVQRALVGAVRATFWNSRLGDWTAKLLSRGKKRGAPEQLVQRPTEAALSLAANDLFAALPKPYREHLSELPDVVQRLEARAADARRRLEVAERHDGAGAAALRGDGERELAQAVAALESIRLDLLRLHGESAADAESLTSILDAARRVGRDLDLLIGSRAELTPDPT
jgi:serine/threonine-protein kinase